MKRIVLLFVIGLLLVACGSAASTETAVSIPEEPAKPESTVVEENSDSESESETVLESESSSADESEIPGFPATNVEEASIVRDRDWTVGAEDPLVTIIEYGDFQ